jgi:hypothetical protein
MNWDFPDPREDPWYRRAYDGKYGKGAFERDFLKKQDEGQPSSEAKTPSDFFEVKSPFKHHWNSEHNVGILERNGKYIGVCVLAAKEITEGESYVRKFGLEFKKDIQWNAASALIDHLSRSPLFKVILITTKKTPFQLKPDIPEKLEGRKNWIERNYQYHKDALDTLNTDVKAARENGMFPVAEDLLKRQKEEALNASRFLGQQNSIDSQIASHLKPYHMIKDNVFAAALFFYIYTSIHDTFEKAVEEIISRKESAKKEAALTYFVKCSDVTDPVIVFSPSFPPYWEEVNKYYNLVLAKDVAGFEADKGVAMVLRKMFTTALEVPAEEVVIEEKIHIPTEEVSIAGPRKAFIGYVVESVVKRQATIRKVFFPLDELVKHALITGATGKGKTFFAMHLALQAAQHGIKCLIVDPHGTFRFLPRHENIETVYVESAQQVVDILESEYREALSQPIQTKAHLRKLIIIDEISAGKFGSGIRQIMTRLDRCLAETRKFGYGFVLICQYATESRGISAAARENAETFFIFRKKTVNELDRIRTLKHPSLNLIPYLEEGFFALISEDFHSEPFFVKVPRIGGLLRNQRQSETESDAEPMSAQHDQAADDWGKRLRDLMERIRNIRSGHAADANSDTDADHDTDDNADDDGGDGDGDNDADDGHSDGADANRGQDSAVKVSCRICGYEWQPKRKPEHIRQCPRCNSRKWKGDDAA